MLHGEGMDRALAACMFAAWPVSLLLYAAHTVWRGIVREERAQLICDQHRTKGLLLWLDVPGRWENAATRKQFWYSGFCDSSSTFFAEALI